MGQFEERAITTRRSLPTDLPDAAEVAKSHQEGAVYKADNGERFRLVHAKQVPAKWLPVRAARKKNVAAVATPTTGAAGQPQRTAATAAPARR